MTDIGVTEKGCDPLIKVCRLMKDYVATEESKIIRVGSNGLKMKSQQENFGFGFCQGLQAEFENRISPLILG